MERKKRDILGMMKQILSKIPYWFEVIISILMLLVIMTETVILVHDVLVGAIDFSVEPVKMNELISSILWLVIGLEFVRMLLDHSHAAVLEVMLFAVARQMIASHTSMLDNLLAVVAIGGIFAVRKYLYSENKMLDGNQRK